MPVLRLQRREVVMTGRDALSDEKAPERIDSTFRNGSLTAIGVVVGFSLGFLSNWATSYGEWTIPDVVAVISIMIGIVFQIRSLAGMLAYSSLILVRYDRLVRIFMIGIIFTALGVALAIFGDVLGLGQHVLRPK
jgi:hypothetical protein